METEKKKSRWTKKWKITMGILLVIIVILALSPSDSKKNNNSSAQTQPKASYAAKITDYSAVNPADLQFYAEVTNNGSGSGEPSCTVKAQDNSDAYHGFDVFDKNSSLASGKVWNFKGDLTITGQGASYVTQVTIDCK